MRSAKTQASSRRRRARPFCQSRFARRPHGARPSRNKGGSPTINLTAALPQWATILDNTPASTESENVTMYSRTLPASHRAPPSSYHVQIPPDSPPGGKTARDRRLFPYSDAILNIDGTLFPVDSISRAISGFVPPPTILRTFPRTRPYRDYKAMFPSWPYLLSFLSGAGSRRRSSGVFRRCLGVSLQHRLNMSRASMLSASGHGGKYVSDRDIPRATRSEFGISLVFWDPPASRQSESARNTAHRSPVPPTLRPSTKFRPCSVIGDQVYLEEAFFYKRRTRIYTRQEIQISRRKICAPYAVYRSSPDEWLLSGC